MQGGAHRERLYPFILILTAVGFGSLCILPHIWQRLDRTYPFQGIEIMGTDQEQYYAARIREVQDGFWGLGSVYYSDLKDQPYVQPPLPEWVQGGLGILLGLDAARTVVFSKFFFGALLFVFMTLFCLRLSGRKWWSLLAVSAVLLAGFVFSDPTLLPRVLRGVFTDAQFLRFSRLTNPQFSSTLFFAALFFLIGWARTGSRRDLIITGVLTGLSFYAYPYTWTYLGAMLLVLLIMYAWQRERLRVYQLLILAAITAVVAIPYLLNQMAVMQHPLFEDVKTRFILLRTHDPVIGLYMLALLIVGLFFARRVSDKPEVVTSLALAGVLSMNQQVLTGLQLMVHHYHWFYVHPLAVMLLLLFLGPLLIEPILKWILPSKMVSGVEPWNGRAAAVALCLVFFVVLGTLFQRESYYNQRVFWGSLQKAAGIFEYFGENGNAGDVVYSPGFEVELLPVYTSVDVYNGGNVMCLCPEKRNLTAFFFEKWLQGLTPERAREEFPTSRRFELSSRWRGTYYREVCGNYECIPDAVVEEGIVAYEEYIAFSTSKKLALYPLHYLLFRRDEIPDARSMQEVIVQSTSVYEDETYIVWKLREA